MPRVLLGRRCFSLYARISQTFVVTRLVSIYSNSNKFLKLKSEKKCNLDLTVKLQSFKFQNANWASLSFKMMFAQSANNEKIINYEGILKTDTICNSI